MLEHPREFGAVPVGVSPLSKDRDGMNPNIVQKLLAHALVFLYRVERVVVSLLDHRPLL